MPASRQRTPGRPCFTAMASCAYVRNCFPAAKTALPPVQSSQPAPPAIWLLPTLCGKMGDAAFLCNYDRLAPLYYDFDSRGLLLSSLAPAGALQYPKNLISALRISIMWQTCFPSTCALDLFMESPWTSPQFTTSMDPRHSGRRPPSLWASRGSAPPSLSTSFPGL